MCLFNQINSHFIDYIWVDFKSIICVNFSEFFGIFTLLTPFLKYPIGFKPLTCIWIIETKFSMRVFLDNNK